MKTESCRRQVEITAQPLDSCGGVNVPSTLTETLTLKTEALKVKGARGG